MFGSITILMNDGVRPGDTFLRTASSIPNGIFICHSQANSKSRLFERKWSKMLKLCKQLSINLFTRQAGVIGVVGGMETRMGGMSRMEIACRILNSKEDIENIQQVGGHLRNKKG